MPKGLRQRYHETRDEMDGLFKLISSDSEMLEKFTRTVIDEDELKRCASSMTPQHYESLKRTTERSESVMTHWLGLPVEPADPYQDGKLFILTRRRAKW